MRGLRRAAVAMLLGGIVGALLRLFGTAETPSQHGGWRELAGPDLR